MTWAIVETDAWGDIPEDEGERCYLNHAYLNSGAFGSLDMAWTSESRLEALGMMAQLGERGRGYNAPDHYRLIEL